MIASGRTGPACPVRARRGAFAQGRDEERGEVGGDDLALGVE
ncbi:hypothetical protein AB0D57_26180 [Streptomyces sp. NPDC048275]